MSDQIAFIGDIHGLLDPLVNIVEQARHDATALVFLGDYVNRGRQSSQVLDYLVETQHDLGPRAHFLLGHHDEAFLAAIVDGRIDRFLRMGGAATLSSYPLEGDDYALFPLSQRVPAFPLSQRVPATHVQFLRNLGRSFIGPGCFAAHDPRSGEALPAETFGVFGHRLLPTLTPEITNSQALIDTGCGTVPDGKLTCFLWPSRTWYQAP